MSARGFYGSYADGGTIEGVTRTLAGGNRIDFVNEDLTVYIWMRVKGQKPGSITTGKGYPIFTVINAGDTKGVSMWLDWTDSGRTEYRVKGDINATVGSANFTIGPTEEISNDEDYLYCAVWNHTAATWTRYYGIDGGALGAGDVISTVSYAGAGLGDTIIVGYDSSFGTNAEYTELRMWKRAFSSGELTAEKESFDPVITTGIIDRWKLLSSTDLTGTANGTVLTMTGTVTNGSMDPVDIQGAAPSGQHVLLIT